MNRRTALRASLALVATLALSACGGGAGDPGDAGPAGPTSVTIAMSSPPNSLDPAHSATGLYLNYIDPAYASLLTRELDGTIGAGLADKWGYVGTGNTTFSLSLRSGVKFADGTQITAADVVASFTYFQSGSGPAGGFYRPLTFSAPDSSTVVVESPTPNPNMAALFTPEFLGGAIISPAGLADPSKLAAATFGAGPYVYSPEQSVSGDHYVYLPNPNYYDQSDIHSEKITIRVIPNVNAQLQALRTGEIDFMAGTPDVNPEIAGDDSLTLVRKPTTWAGLFLLDRDGTVVEGLADVRVRQALNYAIDRAAITNAVYDEFGAPLSQPAMPGYDGFSPASVDAYPYDSARARQLLAEAGYPNGLTIRVNYGAFDPQNTKLVQAVQGQLAEVGVTLELTGAANFGGWVNDLLTKNFAATILSPGAGGGESFYAQQGGFTKTGIMNVFAVDDTEVETAFAQLAAADQQSSATAAQNLTDVIVQRALALPVSAVDQVALYNKRLQGVQFPEGSAQLTTVSEWSTQ